MKIARITVVAFVAGAFIAAGSPAGASEPEKCPTGSHGVVITTPSGTYAICASEPTA